ncbi:MAG: hypothetical protein ABIT71_12585 [Vicinamibacteraceae bacterium]
MTTHSAPTWSHPTPLAWGLTACGVVAGPSVLGAAQAAPALASVAIGLTALLVGFALSQRARHTAVAAPARRVRALVWSPP